MKTLQKTCDDRIFNDLTLVDAIVRNSTIYAKAVDDKSPVSKSLKNRLVYYNDFIELEVNQRMAYEKPKKSLLRGNN